MSGRANAAVLPLSSCMDSLIRDPRLSVLLPQEGSPLNWTVLASPGMSQEPFPSDWLDLLWGPKYLKSLVKKGFLPPTTFLDVNTKNIDFPKKYQSIFIPEASVWNKCWSLPILSSEEQKALALNWNNA